jgi:NTP pyrophosphatase (non-canonical NTP hydrolase)
MNDLITREKLKLIINEYGVLKQMKYFQSEVYELTEAIIMNEYDHEINEKDAELPLYDEEMIKHIEEEIADVLVMINQFKEYYHISDKALNNTYNYKIERQIERIEGKYEK